MLLNILPLITLSRGWGKMVENAIPLFSYSRGFHNSLLLLQKCFECQLRKQPKARHQRRSFIEYKCTLINSNYCPFFRRAIFIYKSFFCCCCAREYVCLKSFGSAGFSSPFFLAFDYKLLFCSIKVYVPCRKSGSRHLFCVARYCIIVLFSLVLELFLWESLCNCWKIKWGSKSDNEPFGINYYIGFHLEGGRRGGCTRHRFWLGLLNWFVRVKFESTQ